MSNHPAEGVAEVVTHARRRVRRLTDSHPEWWITPVAVVLWVGVTVHGDPRNVAVGSTADVLHAAGHWTIMAVAMMLPLAAPGARRAGLGAVWRRRRATVAWYAVGFVGPWLAYGVVASGVGHAAGLPAQSPVWLGATALVALGWQGSVVRRRAMLRCGPTAGPARRGLLATSSVAVSGARHGCRCVLTCWASMLIMVANPHPGMMGVLLTLHLYERRPGPNPFPDRRLRPPAMAYAGVAGAAFAVVLAG